MGDRKIREKRSRLRKVGVLTFSAMLLLCGCGRSGEEEVPVEITNTDYGSYYVDSVSFSSAKSNNYAGYFLGDGISIETALDLNALDSLVYGWGWSLSSTDYTGTPIEGSSGAVTSSGGLAMIVPEGVTVEGSTEVGSTSEGESAESAEEVDNSSGSAVSIGEITSLGVSLLPGQEVVITPVYSAMESTEEEAVDEDSEGQEASGDSENTSSEEVSEEMDVSEPKVAVVSDARVVNYSESDTLSVAECYSRNWYTVGIDSYGDAFNIDMEDGNDDTSMFEQISEQLGYPTSAWEEPMEAEEDVSGERPEYIAFEFPEYTIGAYIVESGDGTLLLEGMEYVPSELWLSGSEFSGLRIYHTNNEIEIVHDTVPTIIADSSEGTKVLEDSEEVVSSSIDSTSSISSLEDLE